MLFVWPWRALGWLRLVITNLLTLIVVVAVALGLAGNETPIPEHSVLYLEPGTSIVEQRSYDAPLNTLLSTQEEQPAETVLHEATSAIRWAAHDDHIKALVIKADNLAGSDLDKLEALAQAIVQFKNSKKPVIAIGDNFSQAQYYLASTADKIYLNPMGSVQIFGFAAYQTYIKDMLDKLAINVHIFRAGEFKSFVEPFVRNDMSAPARENLQQWMDEQWHFYCKSVEAHRQLQPGSIETFIQQQDQLLTTHDGNAAALALDYGLVDEMATRTETEKKIDELAGNTPANIVKAEDYYLHVRSRQEAGKLLQQKRRVAVIHAVGEITGGYQPAGIAGAESLIEQIRSAREDDNVAAIVLRIDSPGGSAFAAELIRNELEATQAAGKPVVASMGGVAASGGYWIAASADEIWASPVTITGSIGVFGVIPTFENSFSKLGAHSDGYSTTVLADAMQLDRPMNPMAARVIQQGVEFTYQEFLRLVAIGRNSTPEAIDNIAQGRVWAGSHARQLDLVDQLGGLDDAIGAAARLAKLTDYDTDFIEPELSPMETLLQPFSSSSLLPQQLRSALKLLAQIPAVKALQEIQNLNDPNHLYVKCEACSLSIR